MKLDYLHGTNYEIEQPKEMYHFNSDTELLGRFMRLNEKDTVLDIGCNTGALLLYAAYQNPKALYGIDLFEEVIGQAQKNLEMNHVNAQLTVSPLQNYEPNHKFDVIVCNPPYFDTQKEELKNSNPYLAAARHTSYLTMDELFQHVSRLLEDDGVFYLVQRAQEVDHLFELKDKYGFYIARLRLVLKTKEGSASGVLVCLQKQPRESYIFNDAAYLDDRNTFANPEGEGR